ncbi:MAG: hypothetical protein JNK15_00430 [Planctomycetes bacterium]|nr:hypothetical protein [Planctomycetota bacterium]
MRSLAFALAALAASIPTPARAQSAAAVTEPGRTLSRPLDVVFGSPVESYGRTILVVVDPSEGLSQAGFADTFAQALVKHGKNLATTRIGLGVVGQKGCIVAPPTLEHATVIDAMRKALQRPAAEFLNVYADVRTAAASFTGAGERVLLLVSLENGDVEDDVEQTVAALQKAKARAVVLTSETTLADSYWAARPHQERPRGTTLTGGDGAVIDVPWGFVFQIAPANEQTPAGFAMWGLTRLSAATDGRVFLHSSSASTQHQCAYLARCLFCSGDHLPPDEPWSDALQDQLAPLSTSRTETLAQLGADPWFRAMAETWRAAADAGLVRGHPAFRLTTTAEVDRARAGRDLDLDGSGNFERAAKKAEEAAARCKALAEQLVARLDKIPAGTGSARAEASARYTRVLLQLTRVNLVMFAAWCRDTAPALFAQDAKTLPPPEVPSIDRDDKPVGIGWSNLCLCHGVKPFFTVELPGGKELLPELVELDRLVTGFLGKYAKSQFGYLLRRNGLAQFWPTFPGVVGKLPRNRPKTDSEPAGPVTPKRPPRQGGGTGGGATGPTTGGGR